MSRGGGPVHAELSEGNRSPAWGSPSLSPSPRWLGLRHLGHGGAAAWASRRRLPLSPLRLPNSRKLVWEAGGWPGRPGGERVGSGASREGPGSGWGGLGRRARSRWKWRGMGPASPSSLPSVLPPSLPPQSRPGYLGWRDRESLLTQILQSREAGAGGGEPMAAKALRSGPGQRRRRRRGRSGPPPGGGV